MAQNANLVSAEKSLINDSNRNYVSAIHLNLKPNSSSVVAFGKRQIWKNILFYGK